MTVSAPHPSPPALPKSREMEETTMRRTAEALEAHFLAEVLKTAGLHSGATGFDGGAGEDQFSSFLRQAQAEELAKAGGIGLAETFFRSMAENAEN